MAIDYVGTSIGHGLDEHRDQHRAAGTTWRYLRLAIGLAVARTATRTR